ncbi:MAG TPA: Pvc16 family protein [Allosphingosinicella sp.]|nr:Pvc16 family protein [Allosphingosinicella sp.]
MAELGAVNQVGESIAALLRSRRELLAAEGRLTPVPPSQDIKHVSISALAGASPPSSGLTISCYHMIRSEYPVGRRPMEDPSRGMGISLDLSYMMVSWSSITEEEQALLSWAMLELNRYPTLAYGQLQGTDIWSRDETVQIIPEDADPERIFRIWDALKQRLRLTALFKARVVRIGYGDIPDGPPVVASRFQFAHGDPVTEPAL